MNNVANRSKEMIDHCMENGVVIGDYWKAYVQNTFLELNQFGEEVFSERFFFANTFGAGAARPVLPKKFGFVAEKIDPLLWKIFSHKLPTIFRRNFISSLLFRWLSKRMIHRKSTVWGDTYYNYFIESFYALLKDDIEKYGLTNAAQRTTSDVEITQTDGSTVIYSYESLRKFKDFLRVQAVIDCKGKTILEIGSGIGELARIFLTTGTAEKYILCDIPPSLAFAEKHLSENIDPSRLSLFDPNRTTVDLDGDQDVFFITPNQLSLVPRFDMGLNLFSFCEMEFEIVNSYVAVIKKIPFSDFVSMNHRTGMGDNVSYFGETEYKQMFEPEFHVHSAHSMGRHHLPEIFDDLPGTVGYQVLRFTKNTE